MSINKKSALSNDINHVAPNSPPSTNKKKTKTQRSIKYIIAQRIANIYTTSYVNNAWTNPLKFFNQKNAPTHAQKSISTHNTSAHDQKSISTHNTSAHDQKSISTHNTSAHDQKSISTNNTSAIAQKSINKNNTSANAPKTISKNIASTNPLKFTNKKNTTAYRQKSIIKNNTSFYALKTLNRNNASAYSQKTLKGNNSSIYARNYTSPYSQYSLSKYTSLLNAQKPVAQSNTPPTTPNNSKKPVVIVDTEKLASIYKQKVTNAYNNRLIFSIYGGYYSIRKALLARGWIEKLDPTWFPEISRLTEKSLLLRAKKGNDYERVVLNKMISDYPAFFVWQPRSFKDHYCNVMPYRNYIRRSGTVDFTTKIGLIGCAEQDHWFNLSGLCGKSCPRFYRLLNTEECTEFIEDYRRTQCRNLVRFVTEHISTPNKLADIKKGTISPAKTLTYAIEYMEGQLSDWEFQALDKDNVSQTNKFNNDEWMDFLKKSESIIRGKSKFKASIETIQEFAIIAKEYLNIFEERRPDYRWDGVRNIWILKPGNLCRGLGIVLKSSLDDILRWSTQHYANNYIVQKYIERPLLIHNTKFDIRQYMLICIGKTDATIWLYKDCYLKFSTQAFSVDDLRVSIHLTNNSVQRHYKIDKRRDRRLPHCNMWSLEQFNSYLKWRNAPADIWSKKIFAGFQENLIGVVLASFDETQFVPNTFELYGCDFMLDQHYNPILIEINCSPDLSPSTPVTARLCPMVLDDLIKVVIDVPNNPDAPTGNFALAHRINYKSAQNFVPESGLNINGNAMTIHQYGLNNESKAMTAHQQEKKNEEEMISKVQYYKKLFAKRLRLTKSLHW